jgi:hypothetical protein
MDPSNSSLNRQIILALACSAVTASHCDLLRSTIDPEDKSFDDLLELIGAKNWIADAQTIPDCLATKNNVRCIYRGFLFLA